MSAPASEMLSLATAASDHTSQLHLALTCIILLDVFQIVQRGSPKAPPDIKIASRSFRLTK